MLAHDLAGKRKAVGVNQADLGKRMGYESETVRALEWGLIDITENYYQRLIDAVNEIAKEQGQEEAAVAT